MRQYTIAMLRKLSYTNVDIIINHLTYRPDLALSDNYSSSLVKEKKTFSNDVEIKLAV